jgi:hypothetical protein
LNVVRPLKRALPENAAHAAADIAARNAAAEIAAAGRPGMGKAAAGNAARRRAADPGRRAARRRAADPGGRAARRRAGHRGGWRRHLCECGGRKDEAADSGGGRHNEDGSTHNTGSLCRYSPSETKPF